MSRGYVDLRNPVSNHPLNRNLVAWWLPLDNNMGGNTLFDLKYRYPGSLGAGSASPSWQGAGASSPRQGGSLFFDGVNDTVALPNFSSNFTDEATVLFWMKRTLASPAGDPDSGFVYLDTAGAGGSTHYPYSDGLGYFSIFRSSRFNGVTLSSSVNRTQWHQLAVTSRNGGNYSIYQNNQFIASTVGTAVSLPSNPFLGISFAVSVYFGGNFRSVRLFNRELSAAEVSQNYYESLANWRTLLTPFNRNAYANFTTTPPAGGQYFDPYTTRVNNIVTCGVL